MTLEESFREKSELAASMLSDESTVNEAREGLKLCYLYFTALADNDWDMVKEIMCQLSDTTDPKILDIYNEAKDCATFLNYIQHKKYLDKVIA